MARVIHPIEVESYRSCGRGSTSATSAAVARGGRAVIHASADLSFADSLVLDEAALDQGREALLAARPCTATRAWPPPGSRRASPIVPLDDARAKRRDGRHPLGRPRCAWPPPRRAGRDLGDRQRAHRARRAARAPAADPALIVGLPVGFVGAAEAKAALASRASRS